LVIYLRDQEGRGIGLSEKIKAYRGPLVYPHY
jgi:GTP cyclohydrolase II